jgi:DNA-binding MarR family transcriptional regulator
MPLSCGGEKVTEQMVALLDEVRLLFHVAAQAAERLHGEPVTAGGRAVLELLHQAGPAPVPAMARRRNVSRQHIQLLVNALHSQGLVVAQDNPAHRRSPVIALTAKGRATIRRMLEREQKLLARLDLRVSAHQLEAATKTLGAVRTAMEAIDLA